MYSMKIQKNIYSFVFVLICTSDILHAVSRQKYFQTGGISTILSERNRTVFVERGQEARLRWDFKTNKNIKFNGISWEFFDAFDNKRRRLIWMGSGENRFQSQFAKNRTLEGAVEYKVHLEGQATLVIPNVQIQHQNRYICIVPRTGIDDIYSEVRLIVTGRPHDVDFVHNTALDGKIFEGQSVTFSCSAKGNPAISHYNLRQNGRELVNMTNGIFKIDEVRLEHSGTYTCVPINKAGLGENKTTILRVQARPSYWRNKLKTTPKSQPSKKQTVVTFDTMKTTPERIDIKTTVPTKAGNLVGAGNIINSNVLFLALLSFVFIQIIEFVRD